MPASYGSEGAIDPHDQPWTTAFYKTQVSGPVFVRTTNIEGDRQADLESHGGLHKAVLAYSANHYPEWSSELQLPDMPYGAFGENLTVDGLSEESVCIGDLLRIGPVVFEVSQPRQPCWKLARRWRRSDLVRLTVRSGRTGWYFRVIEQGPIEAGMPIELIERRNPAWTVGRANRVMHHQRSNLALTLQLADVPRLSPSWANGLRERAERLQGSPASA